MFLDMLKSSNEKEVFMDLAYWVATADGSVRQMTLPIQ